MERSESINELAKALCTAQGEFASVPKDSVNPFFKSKYAALPEVVKTAGPVLAKHGLSVSQFVGTTDSGVDTLTTLLMHQSGQFISESMRLYLTKNDAQGQGSAITYARRYSYMSVLGLVADDDDDGALASGTAGTKTPAFQQAKAVAKKASDDDRPANNTATATEKVKVGAAMMRVWAYVEEMNQKQPEPNGMFTSIYTSAQKWPVSGKQLNAANAVAKKILAANGEDIDAVEKKMAHMVDTISDVLNVPPSDFDDSPF